MLMNLHACSRICNASTVMLIGAGRGQTQHTCVRTCVFFFPLSDRLLFDEPCQISRDILSAHFREHTAKPVQKGAAAGGLKPAEVAPCMEENSPVSCSDISSAINRRHGDGMSGADAVISFFVPFRHRFTCIFSISLIRPYLMSHDQVCLLKRLGPL